MLVSTLSVINVESQKGETKSEYRVIMIWHGCATANVRSEYGYHLLAYFTIVTFEK